MKLRTLSLILAAAAATQFPALAESGPNMEIAGVTCQKVSDPDLTGEGNATETNCGCMFFLE